mgnify:CR=1 FL=1
MIDLTLRHALLQNLADLPSGSTVMVGCSGGADSLALVRAAVHVGRERGISVGALVIDHQLQTGSREVAQEAAEVARELGAEPVIVIAVDVAQGPGSGGLESAARDARRSVFEQYALVNDISAVLLGHTLEDQAETVLLGLARGSGARSLSGMRDIEGQYRRPFLSVSRAHVRDTVSDLVIYEDPHNSNPDFARVRVRNHVLPTLESDLGPGVARALARTADMLRDDADALESLAAEVVATDEIGVDELLALTRAVRTRVLRMLAIKAGCTVNDLTREHIMSIDALLTNWHGQGPLNLPGNVNVERRHGRLNFYKS